MIGSRGGLRAQKRGQSQEFRLGIDEEGAVHGHQGFSPFGGAGHDPDRKVVQGVGNLARNAADGKFDSRIGPPAAEHDRIFAIFWAEVESDPQRVVERWLDAHAYKATDDYGVSSVLAEFALADDQDGEVVGYEYRWTSDPEQPGCGLPAEWTFTRETLSLTLPSEADYRSETVGPLIEKYFRTREGVSTEARMRILRLIENLTLGTAAVGYLTESMHGAGSPQAQRIMIARQVNMNEKKRAARNLCGIEETDGKNQD